MSSDSCVEVSEGEREGGPTPERTLTSLSILLMNSSSSLLWRSAVKGMDLQEEGKGYRQGEGREGEGELSHTWNRCEIEWMNCRMHW